MKKKILVASLAILLAPMAYADGDLSRANVQTVVLEMGSWDIRNPHTDERMYFKPNHLKLSTGQAYKIVLKNVDTVKHEVEAGEFADKIFTRKVQVKNDHGGLLAEVKGSVREIEIGPMAQVEWFVVPVQSGANLALECALPGHKEAGMTGLITIN